MGKKKAFINKKTATVYSLVQRSAEGPDGAAGAGHAGPSSDPRAMFLHLFGGEEPPPSAPMSEAARKENLEFGFPDDGYNYMKHLRVIGAGQASMEGHPAAMQARGAADVSSSRSAAADIAPASPRAAAEAAEPSQSVIIKAPRRTAPAPDVRLVDARRLAVASVVTADDSAAASSSSSLPAAAAPGVPAAQQQLPGRLAAEIAEVEALLAAAEGASEAGDSEDGVGDLSDDFILAATAEMDDGGDSAAAAADEQACHSGRSQQQAAPAAAAAARNSSSSARSGSRVNSVNPAVNPEHRSMAPSAAFASLNDQFDHVLGAYDDSHLGDLGDDSRAAGSASLEDFRGQMAEYLLEVSAATATTAAAASSRQQQQQQQGEGDEEDDEYEAYSSDEEPPAGAAAGARSSQQQQQRRSSGGGGTRCFASIPEDASVDGRSSSGEQHSDDYDGGSSQGDHLDADEAAAARMAERRQQNKAGRWESFDQRDEAAVAAVRARLAALEARPAAKQGDVETMYVPVHREQWDCESVLSLRSHVSYQPAKIASEPAKVGPSSSAAAATGGLIKLSARTGLPAGYAAPRAAAAGAGSSSTSGMGLSKQTLAAATAAAAAADEEDEGGDTISVATSLFERPKGESAEERKARKAAIKEAQREARATKKALRTLYSQEATKQQRQQAAAQAGATFYIP